MFPAIAETSTRLLIGPRADNKSVLSGIGACKVPENREKTTGHLPGALLYFPFNIPFTFPNLDACTATLPIMMVQLDCGDNPPPLSLSHSPIQMV